MRDTLMSLYEFPESIDEQTVYLEDLALQCNYLEQRIRDSLSTLPSDVQALIETYLDLRDELEVHSINKAIRFGKRQK